MARVEYFFDYVSPFAYLADTQLPDLARRCGAEIVYRPFYLGGVMQAASQISAPSNKQRNVLPPSATCAFIDSRRSAVSLTVLVRVGGDLVSPLAGGELALRPPSAGCAASAQPPVDGMPALRRPFRGKVPPIPPRPSAQKDAVRTKILPLLLKRLWETRKIRIWEILFPIPAPRRMNRRHVSF